jgi:hypothetical protein
MLHLTADRLAALADEPPNAIEAAHLLACPACCRERDAQRRLGELARLEAARPLPPLTTWDGVSAALARAEKTGHWEMGHEGRRTAGPVRSPSSFRVPATLVRRLAAAAALLTTGLAAGRYSAGAAPLGFGAQAAADTVRTTVAVIAGEDDEAVVDPATRFRTTDEALVALGQAERQYQLAATFLATHDSTAVPFADSSAVFRARLAALDAVMAGTRTALYEAPHDPVINGYYLATLGAREAAAQQLGTSLPDGQSVSRF